MKPDAFPIQNDP